MPGGAIGLNLRELTCHGGYDGCVTRDPTAAGGIRLGATRARPSRPSDRVLYLPATDSEESASRSEPNRHLRQDGQVLETAERGAGAARDCPAEGGIEAGIGRGARTSVWGSPRVDPPQMPPRQATPCPRDLREAALR